MRVWGLLIGLVASALTAAPPAAAFPSAGNAVVTCTAQFPHVPAQTPAPGSCSGTAVVTVVAGVSDLGVPYALLGPGAFTAAFSYVEPCLADVQPSILVSTATGEFAIRDVPALYGGEPWSADVTGRFSWTRVGPLPVITLSDVRVELPRRDRAHIATGAGTALLTGAEFDPDTHLLCGQDGGPLAAELVVDLAFAL